MADEEANAGFEWVKACSAGAEDGGEVVSGHGSIAQFMNALVSTRSWSRQRASLAAAAASWSALLLERGEVLLHRAGVRTIPVLELNQA